MKASGRILFMVAFSCVVCVSCLDPYNPPVSNKQTDFLVIDGHINTTQGKVIVKIGRSLGLRDTSGYPAVSGAIVSVEDATGEKLLLSESSPGMYTTDFNFDETQEYRLKLAFEGREYQSDLVELAKSAPIDSLSWHVDDTSLQIYASTHDPGEGNKYYRYSYDETYEYRAIYSSDWVYEVPFPVYRRLEEQIFKCWRTRPSTSIILTSTENYSQNRISNFTVATIFKGDRRLWHQHSLLVHQYSMDKESYNYWSQLRKITESLGGLFDPLPYQIKGNLYSTSNPDEIVLGYFSGGAVSEKRIVINNYQLIPGYSGIQFKPCEEYYVPNAELPSLKGNGNVLLTKAEYVNITIVGFYYTRSDCVDCRLEGGTNVKPDFMN